MFKKSVPPAVALGFAASLTFASAWAQQDVEQPRPGMRMEQPKTEMERGMEPEKAPRGELDIGRIDQDKDKLISEDEHKEWRQSLFGRLDGDKDGELTEVEFIVLAPVVTGEKIEPEKLANRYGKLDQQQTGKVSEQEYLNVTDEEFKKADTNGDGKLSVDELRTVLREHG